MSVERDQDFVYLKREDLCIRNEDGVDLLILLWALSRGVNTIYLEDKGTIQGIILVESSLRNKRIIVQRNFSFLPEEMSEDKEEIEAVFNKGSHFIPILNNGQLCGEIIKKQTKQEKECLYWELIEEEVIKSYLANYAQPILVVASEKRVEPLTNRLNDRYPEAWRRYEPQNGNNVQQQTEKKQLIIFTMKEGNRRIIENENNVYVTVEYMFYELLLRNILEFYKRHKIPFIYVSVPNNNELPEYMKQTMYPHIINQISKDEKALDFYYGKDENRRFWESGDFQKVSIIKNGIGKCLKDCKSETYNVIDGKRYTIGTPEEYTNTVHVHGVCIVRGAAVNDKSTICSYLQQRLNQEKKPVRVINYGVGGITDPLSYLYNMYLPNYRSKDVVVLFMIYGIMDYVLKRIEREYSVVKINAFDMYTKKQLREPYFINSCLHCTHKANQILANNLYETTIKNYMDGKENSKQEFCVSTVGKLQQEAQWKDELSCYKNELATYRQKDAATKCNGAIVMNCNPFTLGHLYLIKESLKQVEHLYIFVVQEDRSFFKFEDRFTLVKANCKEFSNVTVVPSGKFIISTLTFPEYFFKEEAKEVTINASEDVRIFGEELAPILNIRYRFVGEEPLDPVTAQYNKVLKEKLNRYGIQVVEIERKQKEGQVISASLVRKLINEGAVKETYPYVPEITYQFLMKHF